VLQLPNEMANLIGSIVDALAVVGLTGLLAFFGFAFRKSRNQTPMQPQNSAARKTIIERSNDDKKEITDALNGSDPAGALAELGNKRRKQ